MLTSQIPSMLSEIAAGDPIPLEKRAYFHARVLNSFYQYILQKFFEEEKAGRLTKAELARRIEKRPEIVSRLLGAPGNWTLETATDLLLGIAAEELMPSSSPLLGRATRYYDCTADWLRARDNVAAPIPGRPKPSLETDSSQYIQDLLDKAKASGSAPVPVM